MSNRHSIPYQPHSQHYFDRLRNFSQPVWLDSGKPHSQHGQYDIMSAEPTYSIRHNNGSTQIVDHKNKICKSSEEALAHTLSKFISFNPTGTMPFNGGLIGYISYDYGEKQYNIATEKQAPHLPDANFSFYPWAIIQDHVNKKSWLTGLPALSEAELHAIYDSIMSENPQAIGSFSLKGMTNHIKKSDYEKQLNKITEYILGGDCYQVNFSQCFSSEFEGDPYTAYLALRKTMSSPYSAYLVLESGSILSLSPEQFISTKDRQISTRPIKGTMKRSLNERHDAKIIRALQASKKNRAENLMIVDLLRNDLGQWCKPGSVVVDKLFSLESYANVHHLVSHISGQLKESINSIDALFGCFPGGSITGAPKKRAMEIIAELEPTHRSIYCGSIGYIDDSGNLDMNIAIRTVYADQHTMHCSGGGGIVSDSNPADEYTESLIKIEPILKTLTTFTQ